MKNIRLFLAVAVFLSFTSGLVSASNTEIPTISSASLSCCAHETCYHKLYRQKEYLKAMSP